MTLPGPGNPVFVELNAADGAGLQALLYTPAELADARAAVLHLHGKGANAYTGPARILPPRLAPDRMVHLALNMRCHDLAYVPGEVEDGRPRVGGGMYETNREAVLDIAAGIDWLRERTDLPIFVSGHSAGGYFLGEWSAAASPIAGRILLSPLTTTKLNFPAWFADDAAYQRARDRAQELAAAGRDHVLISLPGWYWAISARSLLERMDERPGRWLDGVNSSQSPVLLLWGSQEQDRRGEWLAAFAAIEAPVKRRVEVTGADHNYRGKAAEVSAVVTDFIDSLLASDNGRG